MVGKAESSPTTTGKIHFAGFGRIGAGPGEIGFVTYVPDVRKVNNRIELLIFNSQTLSATIIDLKESIKAKKIIPFRKIDLPGFLRGVMGTDIYFLSDYTLFGMYEDRFYKKLDSKRGGFFYYPARKEYELFSLKNYGIVPEELMPSININARSTKISPDKKKFAIAHVYSPTIEIYDIHHKSMKTVYNTEDKKRGASSFNLKRFKDEKLIEYYDFIDASNERMYVLYRGEEYRDDVERSCYIQVYDWNGKYIEEFFVPKKYDLSKFFVDEKEGVLYGQSYGKDAVYKFNVAVK